MNKPRERIGYYIGSFFLLPLALVLNILRYIEHANYKRNEARENKKRLK